MVSFQFYRRKVSPENSAENKGSTQIVFMGSIKDSFQAILSPETVLLAGFYRVNQSVAVLTPVNSNESTIGCTV